MRIRTIMNGFFSQKSREDVEFQLRTPSPNGGATFRSVRPHEAFPHPLDA